MQYVTQADLDKAELDLIQNDKKVESTEQHFILPVGVDSLIFNLVYRELMRECRISASLLFRLSVEQKSFFRFCVLSSLCSLYGKNWKSHLELVNIEYLQKINDLLLLLS